MPRRIYKVYAALASEAKEGWVWLSKDNRLLSEFVHIGPPQSGRFVICEKRTIDENFRTAYNSEEHTKKIADDADNILVLNEKYRERLSGLNPIKPQQEVTLEVRDATWWERNFCAPFHHPHPAVRTSMVLGLISVGLGAVGLALGILGFLVRNK